MQIAVFQAINLRVVWALFKSKLTHSFHDLHVALKPPNVQIVSKFHSNFEYQKISYNVCDEMGLDGGCRDLEIYRKKVFWAKKVLIL